MFDLDGIRELFTCPASIDSPLEDRTWSLNPEVLACELRPSWLIWTFLWTLHKILMENWKICLMQFDLEFQFHSRPTLGQTLSLDLINPTQNLNKI